MNGSKPEWTNGDWFIFNFMMFYTSANYPPDPMRDGGSWDIMEKALRRIYRGSQVEKELYDSANWEKGSMDKDIILTEPESRMLSHSIETIRLIWNAQSKEGLSETQKEIWVESIEKLLHAVKPLYAGQPYNHIVVGGQSEKEPS